MSKKYLFIIAALLLLTAVIGVPKLLSGYKEHTVANQPLSASNHISLAGGGVTFNIPATYVRASTSRFDAITLYTPAKLKPANQTSFNPTGITTYAFLSINITTGNSSFTDPHLLVTTMYKQEELTADDSVLPTNNPLISTQNSRLVVLKNPKAKGSGIGNYLFTLHTHAHYTDGNVYQTNIQIECTNDLSNQTPLCHDAFQQILTSLRLHEPLQTKITTSTLY